MTSRAFFREVQWSLLGFVLPALVIHLRYILATESPVPTVERLLFREDACPYLLCFWIGLAAYALVLFGRLRDRAGPAAERMRHGFEDATQGG